MRTIFLGIVAAIALLPFCVVRATAQASPPKLVDFSAMAGCWERRDNAKNVLVSEQWMSPAGTSILGMGRTVKNGKTTDFEFMRIEERADGLYFVARPAANTEETSFRLKRSTKNEAVFENPDHDFPQRVIYRWTAATLTGRTEGTQNTKPLNIDFPFTRIACR